MLDESGRVRLLPPNPQSSLSLQLSIDEALLECELEFASARFWSLARPAVVLGRSSPAAKEVDLEFCEANGIEVRRRCSGGQTVVTGPGCLMYAVVVSYQRHPELRMLDQAHQFVMSRMQQAILSIGIDVDINGTSDLTLDGRKFSGNSLRCKKDAFVYHGTMICQDFDLSLVSKCLRRPIREPDYRARRSHEDFLTRLPVDCETLQLAITKQWNAKELLPAPEMQRIAKEAHRLAVEKYESAEWTFKVP